MNLRWIPGDQHRGACGCVPCTRFGRGTGGCGPSMRSYCQSDQRPILLERWRRRRWKIAHGNGTESAEFAQKTRILLEHSNFKLKIQNLNEFDVEFWWELTWWRCRWPCRCGPCGWFPRCGGYRRFGEESNGSEDWRCLPPSCFSINLMLKSIQFLIGS